jgi:hypothetical protein
MVRLIEGVTYYPKQWKTFLFLLICTMFAAIGIWMIRTGDNRGYLGAIFFGLGCIIFLIHLLPDSAYLRITAEGLEFCSLFRKHRLLWEAVSEFGAIAIRQNGITVNKLVSFNYTQEYYPYKWGRKISAAMSGYEAALPDTYGFKAEDLAVQLNQHLQEYRQLQSI